MSGSAGQETAAGDMDRMYRYQRYIYDLTRKYYLLGRDALIEGLSPPEHGTVLEVACGTGRNLIHAARRFPSANLYGLDISEAMLATARKSIERAGLVSRIAVAPADATSFEPAELFGLQKFDRIFVSYAVSMIPEWDRAIGCALGCLADGGSLHIVDFGQLDQLPTLVRKGLFAWLKRFDVTPRADFKTKIREFAAARGATLRFRPLRRGYAYYAVISRAVGSP